MAAVVHDDKVTGYFTRLKPGTSYAAFPWVTWKRICDILESISGVGCRIVKPAVGNPNWQVAVDHPYPEFWEEGVEDTPYDADAGRYASDTGVNGTFPVVTSVSLESDGLYKWVSPWTFQNGRLFQVGKAVKTKVADVESCGE